ncbi:MAG TPA: hypothetical protein DHU71_12010 [Erythrobacter sp.]|nr:hypothetical protein [Erythrobacter sp.]
MIQPSQLFSAIKLMKVTKSPDCAAAWRAKTSLSAEVIASSVTETPDHSKTPEIRGLANRSSAPPTTSIVRADSLRLNSRMKAAIP